MKKDWSAIRITLLLYLIILFIPVNYYFAKESFDSMKNDASTISTLLLLKGTIHTLSIEYDLHKKETLKNSASESLDTIEKNFINFFPNKEYIELFSADKMFSLLKNAYQNLEMSVESSIEIEAAANKVSMEINAFSKLVAEMASYKIETALNKLYVSLALTMFLVIILIFFVRTYIRLQFFKHTIYDHVTGLYNKKYFDSVLQNSKELAIRHNKPLSLLLLSIDNYNELKESMNRTDFEKSLVELSTVFSHIFRHSDTVCRIEKNCFASITPYASLENIERISLRLQNELKSKLAQSKVEFHISIGIASCEDEAVCSILEKAQKNIENFSALRLGSAL